MLEVIGAISIFGLVYFCVVFVIRAIEDISTHDSVEIVNEHIKKIASWFFNLFHKEEKALDYHIYLGFDENLNPIASSINNIFSDIGKMYTIYTFFRYRRDTNRLVYRFKVSQPINNMTDEQTYNYCTSLCDSIVQKALQQRNPFYIYSESLVSVSIYPGFLDIYIAENAEGQQENAIQTEKTEMQFKMSQFSPSTPLETDWSESQ